ncbi:uncharacterized protein [Erythrolamprus reginae]|uniref:uncharacterized protein isoform X1 n=1 Tax=Erythrolamprus reginae TaxID=121349 RepID=UPI00396CAB67
MALHFAPFLVLMIEVVDLQHMCLGETTSSPVPLPGDLYAAPLRRLDPWNKLPTDVGYLDSQIIASYDNSSTKIQLRVSWMEKLVKEDPEYWQALTHFVRDIDHRLRKDLGNLWNPLHTIKVPQTLQGIVTCEFLEYGNEEDFSMMKMVYNVETILFVSFNNSDTDTCFDLLKKCLVYGNETLMRTETPVVTMNSRTEVEDGMETHVCRIHGFYPREIDASWTRDGEVWLQDTFHGSVAPNADGTFYHLLSIQINPKERDRYRCHVEHDSLQEPLALELKEQSLSPILDDSVPEFNLGLITGCAVAGLVVTFVIIGSLIFLRERSAGGGFRTEDGSAVGVPVGPGVGGGRSAAHVPRIIYFAELDSSQMLSQFVIQGYVDSQIFASYDSNSRKLQPRVAWMEKLGKEEPQYWQALTDVALFYDEQLRERLEDPWKPPDVFKGLHTLQGFKGCDFLENGSKVIFWMEKAAFNGETRHDMNSSINSYHKEYCYDLPEKFLSYWNETLVRTEPPVVTVSSRTEVEDGMETHICRIHGFYPREIDASWMRDGEVWEENTLHGSVAPNADGTYHYWLSIRIDPKERDRYRCHVEHNTLQEPMAMHIKVSESNLVLTIGCVVAGLVVLCVIVGSLIFLRSHGSGQGTLQGKVSI